MTVGPGGSYCTFVFQLEDRSTVIKTLQNNYERAFNLFKSASYNISDRLPVVFVFVFYFYSIL